MSIEIVAVYAASAVGIAVFFVVWGLGMAWAHRVPRQVREGHAPPPQR